MSCLLRQSLAVAQIGPTPTPTSQARRSILAAVALAVVAVPELAPPSPPLPMMTLPPMALPALLLLLPPPPTTTTTTPVSPMLTLVPGLG